MKTAIIHEWLATFVGSEKVFEQIAGLYPDADLYCLFDFFSEEDRHFLRNRRVRTSFIQHLPFAKTKYRSYMPLMPFAVERFDLSGYELIISSSHAVAKGIRKNPDQLHICYCHTPMRYAWDLREQYLKESGLDRGIKGLLARAALDRLKKWDIKASKRVDYFIANSHYIRDRIKRAYGRDADVIYPPVDVESFELCAKKEDFFLAVSRMVPYKKVDLIVEAFSESGLPLVVIGDGPDFEKVKSRAKKNVGFLGYQEANVLVDYMQKARAFIFAAEEDFGILPVEAQACGTPVIAYGKGGVTETVIPVNQGLGGRGQGLEIKNPTGVFFYEQTPAALIDAVKRFEAVEDKFNPYETRKNAERFGIERFQREFTDFVSRKIAEFSPPS
ncbi:MAG: glycosyltransferase family 4 protein [Nitrospiraceae bacterium]|nr:MAG: glycosyltransferase family 4 protein [Nitrospiraceae bacterium]